jgi:hypothetical protein
LLVVDELFSDEKVLESGAELSGTAAFSGDVFPAEGVFAFGTDFVTFVDLTAAAGLLVLPEEPDLTGLTVLVAFAI